ncbi:MAG: hypothetical protein LBC88_10420 [Spirochaetaceae bacterium]|jgi:hypothetical protein|nr:hypothetical protein [Spirochaetaceae bacterium]
MNALVSLAVFAGVSLNLFVQFGTGIQDFRLGGRFSALLWQGMARFVTVLLFWCLFSGVFPSPSGAYIEYFLAFPLIFAVGMGLERMAKRFSAADAATEASGAETPAGQTPPAGAIFTVTNAWIGQTFVALMLTLRLAASFAEALVLSLSFALGNLFALFLLRAIQRRAALEKIPAFLAGTPFAFISIALISLIFGALGGLFFSLTFP